MNAQTLTSPLTIKNFVVACPPAIFLPEEPVYIPARDYGFDFDEEELGNELLAPLQAGLEDQPIPAVRVEKFEQAYQYFIS